MKICVNCSRVNPDDTERCLECGETEFHPLLDPPFYNSEDEWKEGD